MTDLYRDDLAWIHDSGFGDVARRGAGLLIEELARAGLAPSERDGVGRSPTSRETIVEIGCGSGISSRLFVDAGYAVFGCDASPSMIALAERRAPEAQLSCRSWRSLDDIPRSIAVTAIGEVLGYLTDEREAADAWSAWRSLFARIHASLERGGIFLFDMAGPDGTPAGIDRSFREGQGWAVLVETVLAADRSKLRRRITSFRETNGLYRRDFEEHVLALAERAAVVSALEDAGFEVETTRSYGDLALPRGVTAFLARKA